MKPDIANVFHRIRSVQVIVVAKAVIIRISLVLRWASLKKRNKRVVDALKVGVSKITVIVSKEGKIVVKNVSVWIVKILSEKKDLIKID